MSQWGWTVGLGVLGILVVEPALAQQIVPDTTLGANSSQHAPVGNTDFILGGLESDINLFHSFEEFGVEPGRAAVFVSENRAIENIFARVTGTERSEIFGTLWTIGFFDGQLAQSDTNLFLINPNGILFGPESQLNIGSATRGSFIATTADSFIWENGQEFNAVMPQTEQPLLRIVGNPTGVIHSKRTPSELKVDRSQIRFWDSQSLILLGGEVNLQSSGTQGFPNGGRIEIGSLRAGKADLDETNNQWKLNIPTPSERGAILVDSANIDVQSNNGGFLSIYGRNIEISGTSITAGILSNGGTLGAQAGDITIDASQSVVIDDSSFIENGSFGSGGGIGNSGDIRIETGTLSIKGGSLVSTSTGNTGNAGDVIVNATGNVLLGDGIGFSNLASGIFNAVSGSGQGSTGDIIINANSLILSSEARLSMSTFGEGDTGNIIINTIEDVNFTDKSSIFNVVERTGVGDSGDILINSGTSFTLSQGSQVASSSLGIGNAGDITINASEFIAIEGSAPNGEGILPSALLASVGFKSGGRRIVPIPNGEGGFFPSVIVDKLDDIESSARGNSGNILLSSQSLQISDGAKVEASTFANGNSGNIDLNVLRTQIDGTGPQGLASGIFSVVQPDAIGSAGVIDIKGDRVVVTDGAIISSNTFGQGDAGSININANSDVLFDGNELATVATGAFSTVSFEGRGQGGSFTLFTPKFSLLGGAQVSASNLSLENNAGSIQVEADEILASASSILATSVAGAGGDIDLNSTQFVLLRDTSLISALSGSETGDGLDGNIRIATSILAAIPRENSDIVATGFGRTVGSNVRINADVLLGLKVRDRRTPESDVLATGQVTVNLPETDPSEIPSELPADFLNTTDQIGQRCASNRTVPAQNEFFITGRGGLPPRPSDPAPSRFSLSQITATDPTASAPTDQTSALVAPQPAPLQEASGWHRTASGTIQLIAAHPKSFPLGSAVSCPGDRETG